MLEVLLGRGLGWVLGVDWGRPWQENSNWEEGEERRGLLQGGSWSLEMPTTEVSQSSKGRVSSQESTLGGVAGATWQLTGENSIGLKLLAESAAFELFPVEARGAGCMS